MKMIGMTTLLASIGSALLQSAGPLQVYGGARGGRGKHPASAYYQTAHPAGSRWWHDNTDSVQAARIEAAEAKRQRKAEKLYRDARYSGGQNYYAYAANILNVNK